MHFNLYVIMDIFSHYVVGWMVAHRESSTLATRLIKETSRKQGIVENQLTIHADRGTSMTFKTVIHLLADHGVTKTHNRLHVSNDNPYSESQFQTMKYRPEFPDRFGCIEDSRFFLRGFFTWCNTQHRHSGIGLMTPEMVHYGKAQDIWKQREKVSFAAAERHPEMYTNPSCIAHTAVWIDKPMDETI